MTRAGVSVVIVAAFLTGLLFVPHPAAGQSGVPKANDIPRLPNGKPDFNGVWDHPRVADVTKDGKGCGSYTPGCTQKGSGELQYTPSGFAIWKDEEHRFDYSGHCLPWGYTRAWQVEYPVEIVQTPERMAILFESNNIFHVVHTDGSQHPKNLDPTWMGHSIGWYEGDTLVIDTDRLQRKDLDRHQRASLQRRAARDRAHPLHRSAAPGLRRDLGRSQDLHQADSEQRACSSRMKPGDELMEYWCMENNRDLPHLSR